MRNYLTFLCVICTFTLVIGQPRPCETPKRWQGRVFTVDYSKSYDALADIYYDAIEERIALHEKDMEGHDTYDQITLFKEGVEYRINQRTDVCTTTSAPSSFTPIEVPPNATYYGTYHVGSTTEPLAGFKVNSFGGLDKTGRYTGTWTYIDCMPVTDTHFGKDIGFVHLSFYDLVLGIEDPDVFIPPEQCFKTK